MTITSIDEGDWTAILKLEADAYSEIEPESLETLRSRWLVSPEYCFVYRTGGDVAAYLLAHPWHSLHPPTLFKPLALDTHGDMLFIHDLVVAREHAGNGIGRLMIRHLLCETCLEDFSKITLVAVQSSAAFWAKFEFETLENMPLSDTYGERPKFMQRFIR
ncbi:N-acetyltransferase GCN5 [Oleiphilus messinensis]|uniref:N-acetyltransferase GCN5 n=1 Tax=Oleiphilus messinensis TaxID=141451 RepID=A0A1Y0IHE1_9GAMM|nr:GNAT family N-acetyltransferase [Oleiphilus messinensis]ARU58794.1 N-acetyltransferase GCN5 [Oleiphilus messinensis]